MTSQRLRMMARFSVNLCALLFISGILAFPAAAPAAPTAVLLQLVNEQTSPPYSRPPAAFQYSNRLSEGPGAVGDGLLDHSPGLAALVYNPPFNVTGPGYNPPGYYPGYFYDVTLHLDGLFAVGDAQSVDVNPPIGPTILSQKLGPGSFELTCTGGQVTLLKGSIADVALVGVAGDTTASFMSTHVTYQSGILYDALGPAGFSKQGSLSVSLGLDSPLTFIDGTSPQIAPFTATIAYMPGQFSVTAPEPAALWLVALGSIALLRRRRH